MILNQNGNNIYYVYLYIDPITWIPFYVGKGKGNRCFVHLKQTKDNTENLYKFKKIKSILDKGLIPFIIKVKENLVEDHAYNFEEELIKLYKRRIDGGKLTNMCLDLRPPDMRGVKRVFSEEHKYNLSIAQKNRPPVSEVTRNKRSKLMKGNKYRLGKKLTDEHKMKMSLSLRGKVNSREIRKKMSLAQKQRFKVNGGNWLNKVHSEETKRKMSESAKRRWGNND